MGLAMLAAGCAGPDTTKQTEEQQAIPRPEWRVGDRWAFNRTSLAGVSTVVTRQVVAATTEGYTVRVLGVASEATRQLTRDFHLVQETFGGRHHGALRAAGLVLHVAPQARRHLEPGVPVHGRTE